MWTLSFKKNYTFFSHCCPQSIPDQSAAKGETEDKKVVLINTYFWTDFSMAELFHDTPALVRVGWWGGGRAAGGWGSIHSAF